MKLRIRTKQLDEFVEDEDIFRLEWGRDAIRFYQDSEGQSIFDTDSKSRIERNFVLHLSNAIVYPDRCLRHPFMEGSRRRMPHPLRYAWGNLVLTSNYEVFSESFSRGVCVPPCLEFYDGSAWEADLPPVEEEISEPCILLDLFSKHFGHALVDTPARAWFLREREFLNIKDCKVIGFPTHGLNLDESKWPPYLHLLVSSMGVDPKDIYFPRKPVRLKSLYIPKRISPYGPGGAGDLYFSTMRVIGDAVTGGSPPTGKSDDRIYLSRSRLSKELRGLPEGVEERIEEVFRQMNFRIIHPQELPLPEQVGLIRASKYVAGCAGSQLHLGAFANRAGLNILKIAPSFFNQRTDYRISRGVKASLIEFVVNCSCVPGYLANQSPWTLSDDDLARLSETVKEWAA